MDNVIELASRRRKREDKGINTALMLSQMEPEAFQNHVSFTLGLVLSNLEALRGYVAVIAEAVAQLQGEPLSREEKEQLEADLGFDLE